MLTRFFCSKVYTLCGIFVSLAILAVIGLTIFLDSYKKIGIVNQLKEKKSPLNLLINTIKHLKHKKQILIIPLTLYSGFEQAYISADFTKVKILY